MTTRNSKLLKIKLQDALQLSNDIRDCYFLMSSVIIFKKRKGRMKMLAAGESGSVGRGTKARKPAVTASPWGRLMLEVDCSCTPVEPCILKCDNTLAKCDTA